MEATFSGTHVLRITWHPVAEGDEAGFQDYVEPNGSIGLKVPRWQQSFTVCDVVTIQVPIGFERVHPCQLEVPRPQCYVVGRQLTPADLDVIDQGNWRGTIEAHLRRGGTCVVPRWLSSTPAVFMLPGDEYFIVRVDNTEHIAEVTRSLSLVAS